jgi:3-methylcrotonyl-CoA carboxylase alpha subunit
MFKKILIANRGEIACRVARTAREMGIATVAVYSDADRGAPHVAACDEAVHIGPSPAAESYLVIEKIIEAAQATGAEAIHPGYGFLSENERFAEALEAAGLVFIGPTAETIRKMGSKSAAKDLMEAAGVPTTPGYQGEDQSAETFLREAERIGYPVLLKATAGGGGKGMRRVDRAEDLREALSSAQREAKSAFGDDRFLIEKYVTRARHLEVQVMGDGKGNVVHLFERDCSVQRRHQKVIEEAPAPNLPAHVRAALLEAGVNAARAVDYRGAGTVEFLYDEPNEAVYFMEMNTRLQVEHPVSEEITGLDFVEWQLRIAAGEGLPLEQDQIYEDGHAFEARLYAEDPQKDFVPSVGTLDWLDLPSASARIDSGVVTGSEISPFYDPMIAKIVTYGDSRETALRALADALAASRVVGVRTNLAFLHRIATDGDFAAGEVSTRYIDEHEDRLFDALTPGPDVWAAALLGSEEADLDDGADPDLRGFRLNAPRHTQMWVDHEDGPALLHLFGEGPARQGVLEPGTAAAARREGQTPGEAIAFPVAGEAFMDEVVLPTPHGQRAAWIHHGPDRLHIAFGAESVELALPDPLSGEMAGGSAEGSLTAPMPGIITQLIAAPGAEVEAGATLLVMEAMKMEHALKAPAKGTVKSFRFGPGDQVRDGELLVEFEES